MWKRLMATLLALAALPALAPARQGPPAEEPTPEEEREALDLARQFVERLRENNDVAPLVEELFVKEFGSRLRHEQDELPMCFVAPEAAARASDSELQKFYVAEFNFFSRTFAYWMTRPQADEEEDEDSDSPETAYPPEVMRVLKEDPFMAAAIAEAEAERAAEKEEPGSSEATAGAESERQPEEEDDRYIKNLSMLRSTTDTIGKAADALRAYVPEYSALLRVQEANVPKEAFEEVHWMYLDTREEEHLGFPPGTRLFRVNVEPAHDAQYALTLVREDGRLRILFAVPCLGD